MTMPPALRSKLPLIVLVAVCATPALGPYLLWFFWEPDQFSNYGELIAPKVLPALALEPLSPLLAPGMSRMPGAAPDASTSTSVSQSASASAASSATASTATDARADALAVVPIATDAQPLATLRGRWFLLMADGAACDERCERKLYHLRQLRTMQGKEMERVERVWLIDDRGEPAERLRGPYAGTWIVREPDASLMAALPVPEGGSLRDHIYLVDPLGNLMMRYPPDADPTRIRKDMTRLLKYSRIG